MAISVTEKLNAEDYLRDFVSRNDEAWLVLLIEQAIAKRTTIEKSSLDNVYETFLENNNLKNKKVGAISQSPAIFGKANVKQSPSSTNNFKLKSLTNENGINALVQGATISFHPKLTVIYGKNGSGKSGFVRVIKKISGSRTQEDIWQNIHKSKTKNQCKAKIIYENGGADCPVDWNGDGKISPFDQLNVFDGKCIPIYLTKSLDFSYQPYGFELFQIISNSLREIHNRFSVDISKKQSEKPLLENLFDDKTIAGKFVAVLTANTKPEDLDKFPKWDQKSKRDLVAKEKEKRALLNIDQQSELLQNRLQKLTVLQSKLEEIQSEFSTQNINVYLKLIKNFNLLKKKLATKKGKTLEDYKIPEMESDEWHRFIEAGKEYIIVSQQEDYPKDNDHCIFCRQKLTGTAVKLINLYHSLFEEKESSEFENAEDKLIKALAELNNTSFSNSFTYEKDDFKKILPSKIINTAFNSLSDADALIKKIVDCLNEKKAEKIKSLNLHRLIGRMESKKNKVSEEITKQDELKINHNRRSGEIEHEITELLNVKEFSKQRRNIEKYILCEQWIAKANSISGKLNTKPITDLGSKAWKELVTNLFKKQFEKEVVNLDAPTVNLEFHGEYGSQMREKSLEGLTKIDDFLSEGEQKAVALSDFFAELSMHNKKAPVVFDDPATSFDHERKEKIAKRIVDESESRQAIVFTHDLMFASNIHDLVLNNSNSIDPNKAIFHDMSTEGGRIGIVTENYYPGSVKLENYLPKIQTKITNAEQLIGEEKVDAIKFAYGMLRKAVEKTVEERIFGGIITRWSDRIQMLNESKATLDKTKLQKARDLHGEFSQYIEAHNQSNEMIQQSIPNIDKLKTDFNSVKELAQRSS